MIAELAAATVQTESAQLRTMADELEDLTARLRLAADDPRYYIDLHEDGPIPGSLRDYSEWRCAELEADIAALLADMRRAAEALTSALAAEAVAA